MSKKMLNTTCELELIDGTVVKLTLAFYALYQLKSKKKSVYDRYNKIMVNGPQEELENVTVLYTAYLCANIANVEECMSEIEFMQMLSPDREQVADTIEQLIKPKKA